jgi:dihydrofolate synthase/folylpolyglutamate synthase
MTHDEALAFLNARLNYESRGMPEREELRVDRTANLLDRLGRPHERYPIVHVAGTKGKGSTATMIAAVLAETGRRVGLHTSPHLLRIEERFEINGVLIGDETLANLIDEMRTAIDAVDRELTPQQPELTFFEVTTALMLLWFARSNVDAAVVEVGMGGRLDSTNVVNPAVSVITSISLDHTRQLGPTRAHIAKEKAGIIKPGRTVVSAVTDDEAGPVIARTAEERSSPLRQFGRDYRCSARSRGFLGQEIDVATWRRHWPPVSIASVGAHQAVNAATALAAVDAFHDVTSSSTEPTGMSLAQRRAPGRFEVLGRDPLLLLDVCHNPASCEALIRTLAELTPAGYRGRRVLVFGTSRDKDWRSILAAFLPAFDQILLTQYRSNPRALPVEEILAGWDQHPPHVSSEADIGLALARGRKLVNDPHIPVNPTTPREKLGPTENMLVVAGSFFLVAEAMAILASP